MSESAWGQGPRDKSSRSIKPKFESDGVDASYTPSTPLFTKTHTPDASSAPSPCLSSESSIHDALPHVVAPDIDSSQCSLNVKREKIQVMGNPKRKRKKKRKWTAKKEEALRADIAKHGTGKWKDIRKEPEFNHRLQARSNIDFKV